MELADSGELVKRIVKMRQALLPPYCRDEDDSQRTPEQYIEFYRAHGREPLAATRGFLDALSKFESHRASTEAIALLLDARRRFIAHFPFCRDELTPHGEADPYEALAVRGYTDATTMFWTVWACNEYEQLLTELLSRLDAST